MVPPAPKDKEELGISDCSNLTIEDGATPDSSMVLPKDKELRSSDEKAKKDDDKSVTDTSQLDMADLIADNQDEPVSADKKLSKKEKKAQKKQEKKAEKKKPDSKEKQLLESFNELTRKY